MFTLIKAAFAFVGLLFTTAVKAVVKLIETLHMQFIFIYLILCILAVVIFNVDIRNANMQMVFYVGLGFAVVLTISGILVKGRRNGNTKVEKSGSYREGERERYFRERQFMHMLALQRKERERRQGAMRRNDRLAYAQQDQRGNTYYTAGPQGRYAKEVSSKGEHGGYDRREGYDRQEGYDGAQGHEQTRSSKDRYYTDDFTPNSRPPLFVNNITDHRRDRGEDNFSQGFRNSSDYSRGREESRGEMNDYTRSSRDEGLRGSRNDGYSRETDYSQSSGRGASYSSGGRDDFSTQENISRANAFARNSRDSYRGQTFANATTTATVGQDTVRPRIFKNKIDKSIVLYQYSDRIEVYKQLKDGRLVLIKTDYI